MRALLDGASSVLRATDVPVTGEYRAYEPTTEALRSRDILRNAVWALGLWLNRSGIAPEHLVPAIRSHFARRRSGDTVYIEANVEAAIITWGIDGYYGAGL